jgi:ATP-dependent RNA helicase RhlE
LIQLVWRKDRPNHRPATRRAIVAAAPGQESVFRMLFSELNLSPAILEVLAEEKYTTPTPIQAKAIPPVLAGKDVLGCAQTGTGKTAAFSLPLIHKLSTAPVDKTRRGPVLPRALILSPTRELATQIAESVGTYGRNTMLSYAVIYGGVSQFHQVRALQRGVDILVATPGRLMDLMEQGHVNLTNVQVFILDEADRMLDMGFIQPIRRIAAALPKQRQTLLFSATMPKAIMHLADSLLVNPVKVAVTPVASAAPLITQGVYMIGSRQTKQALLKHLITEEKIGRALVFTRTKHGADRVTRNLNAAGISADAIHGNKAQNARQRALDALRSGRTRVLVATDVAARGIDVDGITHVFNYDIPHEPESYVHRIGRTGRAGATGIAISFCDREEVEFLRQIERLTGKRVPTIKEPEIAAEPVVVAGPALRDTPRDFARDHRNDFPREVPVRENMPRENMPRDGAIREVPARDGGRDFGRDNAGPSRRPGPSHRGPKPFGGGSGGGGRGGERSSRGGHAGASSNASSSHSSFQGERGGSRGASRGSSGKPGGYGGGSSGGGGGSRSGGGPGGPGGGGRGSSHGGWNSRSGRSRSR